MHPVDGVDALTRFDGQQFINVSPADFTESVRPPPRELHLESWWREAPAGVHPLVNGQVRTYAIEQTDVTGVNVDRRGDVWIRTRGGLAPGADRYFPRGRSRPSCAAPCPRRLLFP
jgi:hypothetical protein